MVNNSLEDKRQSNSLRQGQPPPQSAAVYFVSCQLWQSPSEATVSVVLTLMEIQTVDTSKLRLAEETAAQFPKQEAEFVAPGQKRNLQGMAVTGKKNLRTSYSIFWK